MRTYEVFEKALDLIRDPANWCQGVEARDRDGLAVEADSPAAVKWCAAGAVWRQGVPCTTSPQFEIDACGRALNEAAGCQGIGPWNDSHTHAEVVELFQRAIQAEKAKEASPLPETVEPGRTPALEAMYS